MDNIRYFTQFKKIRNCYFVSVKRVNHGHYMEQNPGHVPFRGSIYNFRFYSSKVGKLLKGSDGSPRHGTVFSSLLCFGGGVLLATTLLHLLPGVSLLKNI